MRVFDERNNYELLHSNIWVNKLLHLNLKYELLLHFLRFKHCHILIEFKCPSSQREFQFTCSDTTKASTDIMHWTGVKTQKYNEWQRATGPQQASERASKQARWAATGFTYRKQVSSPEYWLWRPRRRRLRNKTETKNQSVLPPPPTTPAGAVAARQRENPTIWFTHV